MLRPFLISTLALTALVLLCGPIRAQEHHDDNKGAVYDRDVKSQQSGPAPRRGLTGIWEPAKGGQSGIQGKGAMAMESCRRDKTTGKYSYQANAPVTDTGYANPDCLR